VKEISIDVFSEKSVEAAIREIEAYKALVPTLVKEAQEKITQRLADLIYANLLAADHDQVEKYLGKGTYEKVRVSSSVSVVITPLGDASVISVSSKSGNPKTGVLQPDIAFVEFGAGRYASGSNPLGLPISTMRGSFGKGLGLQDRWFFASGYSSTGTPESNAIYRGLERVKGEIPDIVREVFIKA
jgi:hypothetical protein